MKKEMPDRASNVVCWCLLVFVVWGDTRGGQKGIGRFTSEGTENWEKKSSFSSGTTFGGEGDKVGKRARNR